MGEMKSGARFSEEERAAVYRVIAERRDVRTGFTAKEVPDEVLRRLLGAAHAGPSVGLMQPSRYIVIRDEGTRRRVHEVFVEANGAALEGYEGERRELYGGLKLEGILEAPVNVCVVCETRTERGAGLGRRTMPETAAYSTVCGVQNLWLAARAEGIGVGWVSIVDPARLKEVLGVPEAVIVVAYLCVGYVEGFGAGPELERVGWESRVGLEAVVFEGRYGVPSSLGDLDGRFSRGRGRD